MVDVAVGVNLSETTGPDVFTTELNEADYPGLRKDQQQKDKTQRSGFLSIFNTFHSL